MRTYIIRRLIYAIPTLVGISVIVFLITRLSPGDPIRLYTFGALDITEEDIQGLRDYYGLNKPLYEQYVSWLLQVLQGDFGMSLQYNKPALPLLLERLPATLQLAVAALVLQLAIGVPLGVIAALKRGTWIDNVIRFFGVIGHAIPTFWLGLLMIILFAVILRCYRVKASSLWVTTSGTSSTGSNTSSCRHSCSPCRHRELLPVPANGDPRRHQPGLRADRAREGPA